MLCATGDKYECSVQTDRRLSDGAAGYSGQVLPPQRRFRGIQEGKRQQSVVDRFEKVVRNYPDGIAVKAGNQVVSDIELNAMADRVACGF